MCKPPVLWDSLFSILRFSEMPIKSSLVWFEKLKYTSQQHLSFVELADYLCSLHPTIDTTTDQLKMLPFILKIDKNIRYLFLCFLNKMSLKISKKDSMMIKTKLEVVFKDFKDLTSLFYLNSFDSNPTTSHTNLYNRLIEIQPKNNSLRFDKLVESVSTKTHLMIKKVLDAEDAEDETDLKKLKTFEESVCESSEDVSLTCRKRKISTDEIEEKKMKIADDLTQDPDTSSVSSSYNEDLNRIIESQSVEDLLNFLAEKDENSLKILFLYKQLSETFITSIFEELLNNKDDKKLASFLRYILLPFVKNISNSMNRTLQNICNRLIKLSPSLYIEQLLKPFIAEVEVMNKHQSSFLLTSIKSFSDINPKSSLLTFILDRYEDFLPKNDFMVVLQLLQNMLDLNLCLHSYQLDKFIILLSSFASSYPKVFLLSKLILSLLKKCEPLLRKSTLLDELDETISCLDTSLKKACQSALKRLKT